METATLGGGCFWCVEAAFQELRGIEKVVSGYAGGVTADPTYKEGLLRSHRLRRGGSGYV